MHATSCLGNNKLLTKTAKDYQLINHYAFRSAIIGICTKTDRSSMTLITFNLVNNSDRLELLKGGISVNNKKKP